MTNQCNPRPTPVQQVTADIIRTIRASKDTHDLDYAQTVRAITNALAAFNEEHRLKAGH